MTRKEAIEEMKKGKHVHHELFPRSVTLHMVDDKVYDHAGNCRGTLKDDYMKLRAVGRWLYGWKVV